MTRDALDWQEAHDPTEPYELIVSKATRRTRHVARRRKQDCRIFDGMTAEMESAAEAIVRAVQVIAGHVSYARPSFERVDRAYQPLSAARPLPFPLAAMIPASR